jgi:hypothetical protein
MTHHFVLNIQPQAQHDWDKCTLRNPITGERPDFIEMIANLVGNETGAYLISINIDVQVLEKVALGKTKTVALNPSKANKQVTTQHQESIAS